MHDKCVPHLPHCGDGDLHEIKREIINELYAVKHKILSELSGVDKYTLEHLRETLTKSGENTKRIETQIDKNSSILSAMLEATHGNVKAFGVVSGSRECAEQNAIIINDMISQGYNIYFPSGVYYIGNTININAHINITGSGKESTNIVYTGDETLFNVCTGSVTLGNFTAYRYERNYNINSVGISIAKQNASGLYENVSHVRIENITLYNFTNSILAEAVFFFDVYNVFTYWDKIGFAVNKRFIDVNGVNSTVETTTIKCDHLYCGGSRNTFNYSPDSIGWVIYKSSDITMINCVSECYATIGELKHGVSYNLITPYFENTDQGLILENNTGYLMIDNPYFNVASKTTKRLIEQSGTHIITKGGRITTNGYTYINKKADFDVMIITPPVGASIVVGSTNGWDYCGVYTFDNGFNAKVPTDTTDGVSVTRYGVGIGISPSQIRQTGNKDIDFVVGGKIIAKITANGLAIPDSNGTFHTVKISNGNITI